MNSVADAFKSFDSFKKLSNDITRTTTTGGLFTVLACAISAVLFVSEVIAFSREDVDSTPMLDMPSTRENIDFIIEMYDLPCNHLQLIVRDKFVGSDIVLDDSSFNYTTVPHVGLPQTLTPDAIRILEAKDNVTDVSEEEATELEADWTSSDDHFKHHEFMKAVTFHDFTVVNFYAGWCVFCRQFHPKWVSAAKQLGDKEYMDGDMQPTKVRFMKINCVDFRDICQDHAVRAFPTVRLYRRDGTYEAMSGGRSVRAIDEWIRTSITGSHGIAASHRSLFNEGCTVSGTIYVDRMPGHFDLQAKAFGDVSVNPAYVNMSHIIHHFSIGVDSQRLSRLDPQLFSSLEQNVLTSKIAPLDGRSFTVSRFHEAPQHHIKAVRVMSNDVSWHTMTHTAATRRLPKDTTHIPHARFSFDFSPLALKVHTREKSVVDFSFSMFGILGGTVTLLNLCSNTVVSVKDMLGKTL